MTRRSAFWTGILAAICAVVASLLIVPGARAADGCAPYSTLGCAQVGVASLYSVAWSGSDSGLLDKSGVPTGFTMVQPASNPSANGPYLADRLTVDTAAKTLQIDATTGIQYLDNTQSTATNSLDNGLGVGLSADNSATKLQTTVVAPFTASTSKSEQAGLWFGPDEDNYAKLVVINSGTGKSSIQLIREIGAQSGDADKIQSTPVTLTGAKRVQLALTVDPSTHAATASYSFNDGAAVTLGTLGGLPESFFDGSTLDPAIDGVTGYGGIFATKRTNATGTVPFTFAGFSASSTDASAPQTPAGLAADSGNGTASLSWNAVTASDLAGYNVYRSLTTPVPTTGTPLNGGTPLSATSFDDSALVNGIIYHYAVTAVDTAGNASSPATVQAAPDVAAPVQVTLPAQFNFTAADGDPVPDYISEYGQSYANVRGFGWVDQGGHTPLNLVGNGRDRDDSTVADERQDSLVHMQGNDVTDFKGIGTPGAFEVAVPNGSYDVTAGVGDPSPGQDPTTHNLNVEGINVVDHVSITATATGAARFASGTATVDVTDGRLTVDALGGTNTKLDYLTITPADDGNPPPTSCLAGQYLAEYFDNADASGDPVLTRCEDAIDNDYGNGHPSGVDVSDDHFSVRWTQQQDYAAGGYTFTSTSDDGMRVTLDGDQIIDNWGDHGPDTKTADQTLTAGQHTLVVTYYESIGGATARFDYHSTGNPGTCPAYSAEYFANATLSGAPVTTRCEDAIDNDYGESHPSGIDVGDDHFSARWTQQKTFTAGEYTFTATGDDGMRVFLDGSTIIDDWGDHGSETREATRTLTAGPHAVVFEYYEQTGGATAKFSYTSTGGTGACAAGQYQAEYYANGDFSGDPVTTRCEDAIDNDYGNGHPSGVDVDDDNFSVRWTQQKAFTAGEYTFTSTSDDGMRVTLDGDRIIDNWGSHGPETKTATETLTAAQHTLVITYDEQSGPATAKFAYTAVGGAGCSADQYQADYYGNADLTGDPVLTRCENTIDNDYGNGHPSGVDVDDDNFSVRWTQQKAFTAGEYTFTSTSDDGMRVTLDGDRIIDNWGSHGSETKTATETLTAGDHTLVITYNELAGGATAKFAYTAAGNPAPTAPTDLAASAGDHLVALTWTASPGATGYDVFRSATGTPDIEGPALNADPTTETSFTDIGAANDTTYHYVVVARNGTSRSGASDEVTATPHAAVHVKLNFQPPAAPLAAGYTAESGKPYTDGQGWVRQDSLDSATHTPLDLSAAAPQTALSAGNTRDRNRAGIAQELDTLIHMQFGDVVPVGTAGEKTPGAFEYAVPDGTYQVAVSVGDQSGGAKAGCAAPCYDSQHTVNVEGVTAIDRFQATATSEYKTATATVRVTDGRLTIDARGGTNTKLNYVTIDSAAPDTTAPARPSSLTAIAGDSAVSLTWAANSEPDLAGYQVYRAGSATPLNPALLTAPAFTDSTAVNGTAYRYTVTALDTSGNESPVSAEVTATPVASPAFNAKVNFADQATTPPNGYAADYGQAYGARGGDLSYGWVRVGTSTAVDLVGNGRNRNTDAEHVGQPDLRLATFLHMQLPENATQGVPIAGSWEIAVPNGAYTVTAAVGDAGKAVDSDDYLNVEGQNAIAHFVPVDTKFATATRTVVVSDGRLTLSPQAGTNTKLDYVDIASIAGASSRPYITATHPTNLDTGSDPATTSVVNDLRLPVGGVDPATLSGATVTLQKVSDGSGVPAAVATSGGGDTINLSPLSALAPNTLYRFEVTSGVKDLAGNAFLPYSTVFTTGATTGGGGPIAFDKVASGAAAGFYTTMVKGPDGKLYAATIDGYIYRYTINADGTLSNQQRIDTVRQHATSAGLFGAPGRSVIGLAFDPASTASNLILWITDNPEFVGVNNMPDFASHLAKLTGPNLETYTDVLANLPRSVKDHETNSIAFGPDGKLYFTQGASNAMGAAESTWGNRPEHPLTAAVLRLDATKLPATLPLDVKTTDGGGSYDPFAAGAPLTVYASGVRNAFDLVWHSNGHLYTPTNGSAAGGSTPATPNPLPAACQNRIDGSYTGPSVPGLTNNQQAQTDFVYDIKAGRYYGHPNPSRCEWVLDNGNPTSGNDPFQTNGYPVGTAPDRNFDLADVYDAGLHASADGAVEYHGNAFGGALKGKLLVVRYSSGQDIETFDVASSGALSNRTTGITGFTGFNQPLGLGQDDATGNLYISETGSNKLTLLRPQSSGTGAGAVQTSGRLIFNDATGGAASATQAETVTNVGSGPLAVTSLATAADAADPKYGNNANQFTVSGPTLPATLQTGQSLTVNIAFNPTSVGPKGALLKVGSNDPAMPSASVPLRGVGAAGLGGNNEPSLQWILDTYQIPVNSGDTDPTNNTMPSGAGAIGDEVLVPAFTKAESDTPVTIDALAVFGPQGPGSDPNVVRLSAYDADSGTNPQNIFAVPNSSYQSLNPTRSNLTDFDPSGAFGLAAALPALGHTSYQKDSLNTWDSAAPHKARIYPYGTDSYVVAFEDVAAPGVDYQDLILLVHNVKPAAAANHAVLAVSNLDGVPYDDRMVFSRIQSPNTSTGTTQRTHDAATLRIRNTGSDPMHVTGLPITGNWSLVSGPTLPATVAAGGQLDITLTFTATGGDTNNGTLTVQTDAGSGTSKVIELSGFWQSQSENNQEPSVREIVGMMGWKTNVPANLNHDGHVQADGDEIISPYWRRADTSQPVGIRMINAYHTFPNNATVSWTETGGASHSVFGINGAYAQSMLPIKSGSTTTPASATVTPSQATFGFKIDTESSDPTKNDQNPDHANGCVNPCGQHVRFWPVKDRAGTVVPNTYYMVMDYSGINYDYNDNGYLLTNINPNVPSAPGNVGAVGGAGKVTVSWNANPETGIAGYNVYRSTTTPVPTTTPINSSLITGTSFTDTGRTNGTTYYYVVRAAYSASTLSAASATAGATPVAAGTFTAHVNFQPTGSAVPSGYVKDIGAAYEAGRGYGWVRPGTATPVDMTASTRDRGAPSDPRLATLILMQGNGGATQPNTGSWEYAVPNGTYSVSVSVGDSGYVDSTHRLTVEGTRAIDDFVPTTGTPFAQATVRVAVTDGRLTIDPTGGANSKLDYVDITAATP